MLLTPRSNATFKYQEPRVIVAPVFALTNFLQSNRSTVDGIR